MLAVSQDLDTVHKDMLHAGSILVRLFVCGPILDGCRIEDNIRKH